MKSLLERVEEVFKGTELRVTKSKLNENGNLKVWILNSKNEELFWLYVKEENGEIVWC
ncbi:hypothetical protein [Clostridium chauvoei]|uniref:Uncharacterized protein n=2 Tax=Clostridium chauvoei TaxID=46867 RepID=S6F0L7_9CLOT|nr:hypothetical protein [Clostridium chauvoei]MBX7280740.1 hypothetical protein [Clostridium chauvoei]MBX7283223.1 hypothetical protein [Clostridium chauvoei]MBX7285892.1 hypothetical protein [Clostridium chauvoei]MBX7288286.1 hypothetical protein [Clostridium chauvoei]MBX7290825.1 hypothetical protein [Clostridium chauvoei]